MRCRVKAGVLILCVLISPGICAEYLNVLLTWEDVNVEPANNCNDHICRRLLFLIQGANTSIDFAIYGIRKQSAILDALVEAERRGVRVRGIVDADIHGNNYYTDTPVLLDKIENIRTDQQADLQTQASKDDFDLLPWCRRPRGFDGPVQCVGYSLPGNRCLMAAHASREDLVFTGNIMHNKFFVIDGEYVWSGSANISDSGTGGYNANAVVLVNDKTIASWFTREFEQMYERGKFHRRKDMNGRRDELSTTVGGDTIEVKFSPQGYAMVDKLDNWLKQADESIDVAVFFLTHKRLTHHLIRAHQRGVRVRVILDATAAKNGYSKHEILRAAGIPVKIENWGGKMHMKSAAIDGHRLVIGSMNWTSAGERDNDENTFFIESKEWAQEYRKFYDIMWSEIPDRWLNGRPDPESKESNRSCTDGMDNDFDEKVDHDDPGCGRAPPELPELPSYWIVTKEDGNSLVKGNINKKGRKYYFLPTNEYYAKTKINTSVGERWFCSPIEAAEAGWTRPRFE